MSDLLPFRASESSADADERTERRRPSSVGILTPEALPESEDEAGAAYDGMTIEDVFHTRLEDRVVIMLLFNQVVTKEQVMRHWLQWRTVDEGPDEAGALWRRLIDDPALDRARVFREAASTYAFEEEEVDVETAVQFIGSHREAFTDELWNRMQELKLLPVAFRRARESRDGGFLFVTHDPSNPPVSHLLSRLGDRRYVLRFTPEETVDQIIEKAFVRHNQYLDRVHRDKTGVHLETSPETDSVDDDLLEAEINQSTLLNLFEAMLIEAVREGASDIHVIHNPESEVEIHFRVQGELGCWRVENRFNPEAFAAVVKDNAMNVDRFERDRAQDGFIQREIDGALVRFRVSVLPITNADYRARSESIVIRVLDDRTVPTDLRELGVSPRDLERIEEAVRQPHGMVVLTGPTGSGKTTTLYAALQQLVTPKVNVLTVEDPVEYVLPRVRQIKLNHKLPLDLALRSILRHDPDIVMVGEMRDRVTADVAVKLANTGHLTLSTLHTNDAPSAISRLYKMGVEPFLIAYAINIIVAQRLIRTLCPHCKRPADSPSSRLAARLGFTEEEAAEAQLFEADEDGCAECRGGFAKRRAITETLVFTDEIRELILTAGDVVDERAVRASAREQGMQTLSEAARALVLDGETSVREMMRVVATAQLK